MPSQPPKFAVRAGQWLDLVADVVSPAWGMRRKMARDYAQAVGNVFDSSLAPLRHDRQTGPVSYKQGTLDERLPWWDRLKMIAEFDRLVHENALLSGLVDQYLVNVIPPEGIRPIPQTGDKNLNAELTERFDEWAETAEVRGLSFWEYQRPWLKSVLGHGDCLTLKADGRIQGISANRMQTPPVHAMHEASHVHQGVYTGEGQAPLGYYVATGRGTWSQATLRFDYLPAEFCHFGFDPAMFDLDCHRGRSRFLTAFPLIKRVDSLLTFKTFQEKMAAVFGIAITKDKTKPTSPLTAIGGGRTAEKVGEAKTTATRPDIELFPGMGITLNSDEDIKTITHNAHAGDFESLIRFVCRILALGANLPLEFCLLDWTKANYYGNKMAASMGKRQFMQTFVRVRQLVSWTYLWKLDQWAAEGTLKLTDTQRRTYRRHETTLPLPIEVDELKAFQLHRQEVESGVNTWESWCRQQNRNFTLITQRRKEELEEQKAAGLPIIAASTPGIKLLSELENEK